MKSYNESLELNDTEEHYTTNEIEEMKQTTYISPIGFKRLIATIDKLQQENEYLNGLRSELLYYKALNNLVESHNMMENLKQENTDFRNLISDIWQNGYDKYCMGRMVEKYNIMESEEE